MLSLSRRSSLTLCAVVSLLLVACSSSESKPEVAADSGACRDYTQRCEGRRFIPCVNGEWDKTQATVCYGSKGCVEIANSDQATCYRDTGEVGAACGDEIDRSSEGLNICTPDGTKVVKCTSGVFVLESDCSETNTICQSGGCH